MLRGLETWNFAGKSTKLNGTPGKGSGAVRRDCITQHGAPTRIEQPTVKHRRTKLNQFLLPGKEQGKPPSLELCILTITAYPEIFVMVR